jgi:hypothetical protein
MDVTKAYLRNCDRNELIQYLESWGFQCYDNESTSQLREAAIENYNTEKG